MGVDIVGDIVEIITAGLVDYAKAFGEGLSQAVMSIFLENTAAEGQPAAYSLSTTGQIIVVFAALALAIGLTTLVFKWVTSLGARN